MVISKSQDDLSDILYWRFDEAKSHRSTSRHLQTCQIKKVKPTSEGISGFPLCSHIHMQWKLLEYWYIMGANYKLSINYRLNLQDLSLIWEGKGNCLSNLNGRFSLTGSKDDQWIYFNIQNYHLKIDASLWMHREGNIDILTLSLPDRVWRNSRELM